MTRGGEGVWEMGKMMTNDDKRGGGGQKSEKNDYVICERSLKGLTFNWSENSFFFEKKTTF